MANLNAPRGLVPSRYANGSAWNGATNLYYIASTDLNAMYPGDPVITAAVTDGVGTMGITKATVGTETLRGVIVGFAIANPNATSFQGVNLDLSLQSIPATKTTAYYALVVDDPDVIFEVQDDGTSVIAVTSMGKNASLTIAAPTAPVQNSATTLLNSSVNTTQALNLRLMGAVQRANNDPTLVNAKWLVKINQHELMGNTAGI